VSGEGGYRSSQARGGRRTLKDDEVQQASDLADAMGLWNVVGQGWDSPCD
jgi:hypothetical protein